MSMMLCDASRKGISPLDLLARQVALLKPGGWLQVTGMVSPPPFRPSRALQGMERVEETVSAMHIAWGVQVASMGVALTVLHRSADEEIGRELESYMEELRL